MKKIFSILFVLFVCFGQSQIFLTATSGTLSGTYPTLKAGFDKINDGTHQGTITITVGSVSNEVITETVEAVLTKSGSGSANYNSLSIVPGATNVKITGNLSTTSLVKLDATSNVTIDGRIGGTGSISDLTLENTATGSSKGALMLVGVTNLNCNYVTFQSSTTSTSYGTVFMQHDALAGGVGCTNVVFDYCIFDKAGANLPKIGLNSRAASGKLNQNNVVKNSIFKNFVRFGIFLGSTSASGYNSNWEISTNTFYQETTINMTTSDFSNYAISVGYVNTSATAYVEPGTFIINNNVIGGNGTGGDWQNVSSSTATTMTSVGGIFLSASTTVSSEIQGNVIQNFSVQTYVRDQSYFRFFGFNGIYVSNSKVNVGDQTGNQVRNIYHFHSDASFGGVISGIFVKNNSNLSCIIKNNSISSLVSNSASGRFQYMYGIYLHDGSSVGTDIINNNIITELDGTYVSYVYGIYGLSEISQNHISYFKGGNGFEIFGIYGINGPPTASRSLYRIENNEIILGTDKSGVSTAGNLKITGIYISFVWYIYYNSVLIQGTHTTTNSANTTQCINLASNATGYVFKNNLMYNDRTGGSSKHYACITAFSNSSYIVTSNNAYVVGTGVNNFLGRFGVSTDKLDLAAWNTAIGESNSIASTSDVKTISYLFPNLPSHNLLPVNDGWLCAGIVVEQIFDFLDIARNPSNPTTIGAYELSCGILLPVDFVLNGKTIKESNYLYWITYSEINNNYFVLERSTDCKTWEYVTHVIGAGNSFEEISYEYLDRNVRSDEMYYRLKQVDFNGASTYSNTVVLESSVKATDNVLMYPNPFRDKLSLHANESLIRIEIVDLSGKIIYHREVDFQKSISLNFDEKLAPGTYYIRTTDSLNDVLMNKIIKY